MAVSAILNFGKCSSFDLDDIKGRVITLYKGFPGWGVHFWSYVLDMGSNSRSNQMSKVKFVLKSGIKSPLLTDDMPYLLHNVRVY